MMLYPAVATQLTSDPSFNPWPDMGLIAKHEMQFHGHTISFTLSHDVACLRVGDAYTSHGVMDGFDSNDAKRVIPQQENEDELYWLIIDGAADYWHHFKLKKEGENLRMTRYFEGSEECTNHLDTDFLIKPDGSFEECLDLEEEKEYWAMMNGNFNIDDADQAANF